VKRDDKKKKETDFDSTAYLAELSAEGRQRGYQEFTYKQRCCSTTPSPDLAFRVLGRDGGEINFDNLRIWELDWP
jgi:hypothetical protein